MADYTKPATINLVATSSPLSPATAQIYNSPCRLFSVYVNTVLSAHAVSIEDYSSAESPLPSAVTRVTLPASLAAGTLLNFPGLEFKHGIRVVPNVASTGNITLAFQLGTAATKRIQV